MPSSDPSGVSVSNLCELVSEFHRLRPSPEESDPVGKYIIRRIAQPQTVPDHEDDAADDPPIIDPRHTMR